MNHWTARVEASNFVPVHRRCDEISLARLAWLPIALLAIAAGCHHERQSPTIGTGDASPVVSPSPIKLTESSKACATNGDCVIAANGCCSKVSTNRTHADAVRKSLQDTDRYCPVKKACGRGADGTDDGQPAECNHGRCALPLVMSDDATSCKADDDCVIAMLDCCSKVAVSKTYEERALQAMHEIETDRPHCPPSASCVEPPPACVAGKCQRRGGGS